MRDTRITILTGQPLTISSNSTTNGATIDFMDGYTGDYSQGSDLLAKGNAGYGIGVELLFTSVTGTAFNVDVYWQVSDDASTWYRDQQILANVDLEALATSESYKVQTRLRSARRYARIVIVTTNMSGESFVVSAWASDGTTEHGFSTNNRV